MSKILELADAYATEKLMSAWIPEQHKVTHARIESEARADLQAEVEKLEKDAARFRFIETHPDYGACKWDDGQEGVFGWFHVTAAHIDAAMEATK